MQHALDVIFEKVGKCAPLKPQRLFHDKFYDCHLHVRVALKQLQVVEQLCEVLAWLPHQPIEDLALLSVVRLDLVLVLQINLGKTNPPVLKTVIVYQCYDYLNSFVFGVFGVADL